MAKFVLIFLAIIVVLIFAFSYILGAVRRLILGKIMKQHRRTTGRERKTQKPADEVLYEKDGVTALRGEWKPKQDR